MLPVVVAGKMDLGKFIDVGDRPLQVFLSDIFHFLSTGRCGHPSESQSRDSSWRRLEKFWTWEKGLWSSIETPVRGHIFKVVPIGVPAWLSRLSVGS